MGSWRRLFLFVWFTESGCGALDLFLFRRGLGMRRWERFFFSFVKGQGMGSFGKLLVFYLVLFLLSWVGVWLGMERIVLRRRICYLA